jgi:arginyl-tRNA synthetase
LESPRDPSHGDVATNVAMRLAGKLKRKPREIAEEIASRVEFAPDVVSAVEVAGPGFINFRLGGSPLGKVLTSVLKMDSRYGSSEIGGGKKVNVEFVSANPTGPLHVGHGRGAALGDAIAELLSFTGHNVTREFYVNDAGVQIDRLAQSLWARIQNAVGRDAEIPEGGYHGEYLVELAGRVLDSEGKSFADLPEAEALPRCRDLAVTDQRAEQDRDLAGMGVKFDVIFSETSLYQDNSVEECLELLRSKDLVYERDGATWLRTEGLGDEKDRVVRKSDGSYTYFMPDIAYHNTKAKRGFERAIDVWGADHHGYIPRMSAAMLGLGNGKDFFDVAVVQLVKIIKDGEEVKFSKRAGDFVTLRELYEQTGIDAARYFFLMRKGDSHFVFDLDLATRQNEENPVYYVQYAHTRICSIFRKAEVTLEETSVEGVDLSLLSEPDEAELIKQLGEFPMRVEKAAQALEPHRIINYLDDLARLVNGWYHRHRVLDAPEDLKKARLVLARAAQLVLRNGLTLIGVAAPERM